MFACGFVLMSFVALLTLWSKWHILWQVSPLEGTNYYLRGSKGWLFKPLLKWLHCQEEHVLLSEPAGRLVRKQGPAFPGVKQEQRPISAMKWWLCAEGESWCAVTSWLFFVFTTTIQIFASVSQPKLLSDWHIWSVTAYHTMHGTNQGALQCPRIQLCYLKEDQGFSSYEREGEEIKHVEEP